MVNPTKSVSLYNDTINIDFFEKSHSFKINGERGCPSVTACTGIIDKSGPLMHWAVNLSKEYLLNFIDNIRSYSETTLRKEIEEASKQHRIKKEAAATIGSDVHDWCEQYIFCKIKNIPKDLDIPKDEKVRLGVMAFLKWVDENKIKFLASEAIVYSKKYKYVGFVDCIAKIGKEECVIDFKTGKGVYPEMYAQVAGYRQAAEEERGKKFDRSMIAHFSKETGEFTIHEQDDYKKDFKAFLSCLSIKRWLMNSK